MAIPVSVVAHDFWLQPDNFMPAAGADVNVRLFVGDHFANQKERAFQKKRTVRIQWFATKMTKDITARGQEGSKPFIQFSPQHKGQHLITLERDWAHIELEAKKFNSYLEHEGLKNILKHRHDAGEDNKVGKERYRRYLKSLMQVGGQNDQTWKRQTGHRLEIVPLSNPYGHKPGDQLKVLVLFDGKPLSNAQIEACHRGPKKVNIQSERTDKSGQVAIKLNYAGPWLVRLVHMRKCTEDPGYDWESFWSAFSFALPEGKK